MNIDGGKYVLIDGSCLIYRAFYALPTSIKTSDGHIANAVYGTAKMLFRLIKTLEPTHIGIAWDVSGPSFRKDLFPLYKENRDQMPPELVSQLDLIRELVAAFDIQQYSLLGFEADDIIGTIATCNKNDKCKMKTCIITSDKDLYQLISDETYILQPSYRGNGLKIIDQNVLHEVYGISPEQIVYWKSLAGDPSDNIPGVRGVGDKTAIKLVTQYGNIEAIVQAAQAGKIKGILGKRLQEAEQDIRLFERLVTIKCDLPFSYCVEESSFCLNQQKASAFLKDMGFSGLVRSLNESIA